MRRALGAMPAARPVQRRSTNRHPAAFDAHRNCNVRSVVHGPNGAECTECGNKWRIQRNASGEPIGCTILPRVNVEALVG